MIHTTREQLASALRCSSAMQFLTRSEIERAVTEVLACLGADDPSSQPERSEKHHER